MEKTLNVIKKFEGERLDKFIHENLIFLSRTKIHRLIKGKKVSVNSAIKKPSYCVKEKDKVKIAFAEEKVLLKPFAFGVKIIYEDRAIIVVDKPTGLSVHPHREGFSETIINALIYMGKDLSTVSPQRAGVVHRLDKGTSGVMVLAKTNSAHLNLVNQFKERKVKKEYRAICWGEVKKDKITVDLPLARDKKHRLRMKVSFLKSKRALTHVTVLERFNHLTYLSLEPFTGRMHQLRVHLKFLGFPIIGDKKYGVKDKYKELFLHAHSIGFYHPETNKFLEFESKLPKRFNDFIKEQKCMS